MGHLAAKCNLLIGTLQRMFVPSALAFAICACSTLASAQVEPKRDAAQHPLWALLVARTDSRTLKAGDAVQVKVVRLWTSRYCMIPIGTAMQGKVVRVESRKAGRARTELTVHFTVSCVEGQTVTAQLIALLYPKGNGSGGQMATYMDMPMGIGPGASGRQSTDVATLPSPMGKSPQEPEPKIKVGEVHGVRHVSLRVPAQAGDTMLMSRDDHLELQQGTRMAFWLEFAKP